MKFSPETSANALVSCGRYCCICHNFCGLKIQLHHIQPTALGGNNSFDNCIPLCFNCHSDMEQSSKTHNLGKSYSMKELKLHRNNWYKLNKNYSFTDNSDNIDMDISLINKIKTSMKFPETYYLVMMLNTELPVNLELKRNLGNFNFLFIQEPWLEFYDCTMENLRYCQLLWMKKSKPTY